MGRSPELFNSGYYEWFSGARDYVSSAESALLCEWCTRVSSAENALLREWCMRVVQESGARGLCTRVRSGARVVHEITEWCTRVRSST